MKKPRVTAHKGSGDCAAQTVNLLGATIVGARSSVREYHHHTKKGGGGEQAHIFFDPPGVYLRSLTFLATRSEISP